MEILDAKISSIENNPPQQFSKKEKQKILIDHFHATGKDSASSPTQAKTISNPDWDKKIIKIATLKLGVKDFKNYNDNIHHTIK